jgi:hypothetical protein
MTVRRRGSARSKSRSVGAEDGPAAELPQPAGTIMPAALDTDAPPPLATSAEGRRAAPMSARMWRGVVVCGVALFLSSLGASLIYPVRRGAREGVCVCASR